MSTQEQQQQAARCIPTRSSLGTSLACLLASLAPGLVYYALLSEAAAFPPQSAAPLAILANLGFLFHLPLVLLLVARWLLHSSTFSTSSLLHIALSLVTLLSLALTWREGRVPLSLLVLSAFFAGLAYHSLTVAGWSLFKSAKPELLTAMSIGLNIAPLVAVVLALVQLSHAEYSTQGYFTTVFAVALCSVVCFALLNRYGEQMQAVDLTSDWQPGCGLWADKDDASDLWQEGFHIRCLQPLETTVTTNLWAQEELPTPEQRMRAEAELARGRTRESWPPRHQPESQAAAAVVQQSGVGLGLEQQQQQHSHSGSDRDAALEEFVEPLMPMRAQPPPLIEDYITAERGRARASAVERESADESESAEERLARRASEGEASVASVASLQSVPSPFNGATPEPAVRVLMPAPALSSQQQQPQQPLSLQQPSSPRSRSPSAPEEQDEIPEFYRGLSSPASPASPSPRALSFAYTQRSGIGWRAKLKDSSPILAATAISAGTFALCLPGMLPLAVRFQPPHTQVALLLCALGVQAGMVYLGRHMAGLWHRGYRRKLYRGLLLACVQLLLALIFTVCAVQGHLFSRTTEPQRIYPLVLSFVAAIAWLHGYISSYTYYTVPLTEFGVSSNDESVVRVCAEATLAERLSLLLGSGLSVLLVSFAV